MVLHRLMPGILFFADEDSAFEARPASPLSRLSNKLGRIPAYKIQDVPLAPSAQRWLDRQSQQLVDDNLGNHCRCVGLKGFGNLLRHHQVRNKETLD